MAVRRRAPKREKAARPSGRSSRKGPWLLGVTALALLVAAGVAAYVWFTLPDPASLRDQNPKTTAMIESRSAEARQAGRKPKRVQSWVTLGAIAPHAVSAVLISEDAAFYQHDGIDTHEVRAALEDSLEKGELTRGASTITQQLAKNLWLSEDRSLLRKAREVLLARRLEETLPKKRILTIYLNIAEWGEGVYGIEAAAKTHFGVSAKDLSLAQSAILAAMLPAPRTWSPAKRSPKLLHRSLRIVEKLQQAGRVEAAEAETARRDIAARLTPAEGSAADEP